MFDYIEKLRQKSPAVRKLIAFSLSFLVDGIIFLFWILVTMPSIWSDKSIADRVSADQPSPISSLFQIFSQGSSVLNDQLSKLKNIGQSQNEGNIGTSTPDSVSTTTETTENNLIIEATTTEYINQ